MDLDLDIGNPVQPWHPDHNFPNQYPKICFNDTELARGRVRLLLSCLFANYQSKG